MATDSKPSIVDRPALVVYGANAEAFAARLSARNPQAAIFAVDDDALWTALAELHHLEPERSVIVIAADAWLPERALPRLLAAARSSDADVISALGSPAALASDKWPREHADDTARALDRGAGLYGARALVQTRDWSDALALMRPRALAWIAAIRSALPTPLPDALGGALVGTLVVLRRRSSRSDDGLPNPPDARREPPLPSDAVRRVRVVGGDFPAHPGLDRRPVVLHLLHGWGGGAARFVTDLASVDRTRCHLALIARSNPDSGCSGEALTLIAAGAPTLPPLGAWTLDRPIDAVALDHATWRGVAREIVRDYAVDALVVSSLIGHSLDALTLGLPTTVVGHDHFPLWPYLHADFDAEDAHFDRAALARALARHAPLPFASRNVDYWSTLRGRYVEALIAVNAAFVSPSASAAAIARRIAPELATLKQTTIAHGLAPFATPPIPSAPPPRARPRLLVLGRINGAKGVELLLPMLARLTAVADVYLLGAGASAHRLFGAPRVTIELDYVRAELPAHLERIAPDLALLPSMVAETYGYALSELAAFAIPVLASAIGSYRERIVDGVDGFLAPADPNAFAERALALLDDPDALMRVRTELSTRAPRSLEAMLDDWRTLLPDAPRNPTRAVVKPVTTDTLALADAARSNDTLTAALAAAREGAGAQQRALDERAAWAAALEVQFTEKSRWAEALVAERDIERRERTATFDALKRTEADLDERTAWAQALNARLEEAAVDFALLSNEIGAARAAVEAASADAQAWRAQLDSERARLEADLDERTAWALRLDQQLETIYRSRSWWLTKPIRWSGRAWRSLVEPMRFRLTRAAGWVPRARRSLALRGWGGSWRRLKHEFEYAPLPDLPRIALAPDGGDVAAFAVPTSAEPRVSIVIPVYNHIAHTVACLRSLAAHPGSMPFEVIVVDDCSTDGSAERLSTVSGITLHRNAANLGFIGACNAGLRRASGEYVVFLNNDTEVCAGWLEALVGTFEARTDAGLVGAKLIYPDARLQEAGGIVFDDGSGWNYGRFDDPRDPRYNFVREVDYCSGAAIMLPRLLLDELGGFDGRYAPAYYEDTDLAFRIRDLGLKVYYQPAAEVIHHEGISSGTDLASGVKRHQVINQKTFVERWAEALPRQPAPGTPIAVAREHRVRGRVLIVDATTPEPDQDSGSVRMVNLIRILTGDGWKVQFLTENRAYVPRYTAALQQLGVEVLYHPFVDDVPRWFAEHGKLLDAVILSRHYVASAHLPLVRANAPQARVLFDTVDLHYLREARGAALPGAPGDLAALAARTREAELGLVAACDVTLVVSPIEQALLAREVPAARVAVLSNVHELGASVTPRESRAGIWFVGGFQHPPNVDAMRWFVDAIWPRVAAALPDARFHIVGSKTPDALRVLASERVVVHGHVADLAPFLDDCVLAVAPLRYGAGVKGKVNQSMAHGQPVVATPIAVEGMHVVDGRDALIAEDAEAFADAVIRLYRDRELWQTLSINGRDNVAQHFSFDAARAALREVLPQRRPR